MLIKTDGIEADFSHQNASLDEILSLTDHGALKRSITDMYDGKIVNKSEQRPALHTALRTPDLHADIKKFCESCDARYIVVIGIGGSYLGTLCVHKALKKLCTQRRKLYFIANTDVLESRRVLGKVVPAETLFIVISKTFTTSEVLYNMNIVKQILGANFAEQTLAVTENVKEAMSHGIQEKNIFKMWDWVGGRFSVWSAVGMLPLSLVYGFDKMSEFLSGGHAMDRHFLESPFEENIPVLMGLSAVNNVTKHDYRARAIVPYSSALSHFVPHIQQLQMESNGKTKYTGEIIFGEPGTNAQHSFFQLIHQGRITPVDFIGFANSNKELMYNFKAQQMALEFDARPFISLVFDELSAFSVGQLFALYELQTVVQGFVWGINPFDQPGVELGKKLAQKLASSNGC